MIDARVQSLDFEPGRQVERLGALPSAAAVWSFTGHVAGEGLREALVEHHAAMAREQLNRSAAEAAERWPLQGIILIHRFGRLAPGARLLFAGAAAADPDIAQQACRYLVDALRTRAPFWRKDLFADGSERWR